MTLPEAASVLGVRSSATLSEIRRAYRRLARAHHPDRNEGAGADAFDSVVQAYERLRAGAEIIVDLAPERAERGGVITVALEGLSFLVIVPKGSADGDRVALGDGRDVRFRVLPFAAGAEG